MTSVSEAATGKQLQTCEQDSGADEGDYDAAPKAKGSANPEQAKNKAADDRTGYAYDDVSDTAETTAGDDSSGDGA
jgi:hypothetical protein